MSLIKVDWFVNPAEAWWIPRPGCDFTSDGCPQVTGNWAMRGEELYIELRFSWKRWFTQREVTKYVHSEDIKVQDRMIYFSCAGSR